ncbi:S8 family serine peptidase [Portibacter lacus]|uniref:Peptidase S8/S53 domain-containing protein n=1 Tax=Portibacter lacus TaxID=1099794 RepID=A0AA37WBY5_9BACT|nr:S8 family serine peptidase [Portibacter lacus]GLR15881.1 hypothetical protein GCM10007940_04960 [Portibacter lacus]
MADLRKIKIKEYNPLLWGKKQLYIEQAKVLTYLSKKFGPDAASFLAQPNDLGKSIKYSANNLGLDPTPITELSKEDRVKYQDIFKKKQAELLSYIDDLQTKDAEWKELLSKSIVFPSEDHIYCGNDNVAVTAWGFESKEGFTFGGFSMIRKPQVDTPPDIDVTPEEPPRNEEKNVEETPILSVTGTETTPDENENPEETDPPLSDPPPPPWWKRLQIWFGNWKSCLGTLLLLILLILLLSWLFNQCDGPSYLPADPAVIQPVDPVDVVPDKDSTVFIVGDRLNVVLKGENKHIKKWAQSFKALYPDDLYSIIYYDDKTARIQLKIPTAERDQIKKDLPTKMPTFDMLIWTEQVFKKNKQPSDPDFMVNAKSWYFKVIKAQAAWDYTYGSEDIVIAIIDDGFDITHPELKSRIVKPYNVCERSTNVFTNRTSTHGTHVAGTALGEKDNGSGICGIAPSSKLMPIQVSDRNDVMTNTAIIDAILYAINEGADVINMSLGLFIHPTAEELPLFIQKDIIRNHYKEQEAFWNEIFSIAEEANVQIVLAAGNSNVLVGLDPLLRDPRGIKVNAIDKNIQKANFSNFGSYSTVSAPGVDVYSSTPNGQFEYMQGTSMASPIVAGAVGLIKSINKSLSTEEIIKILQNTGKPIPGPSEIGNLIQLDLALKAAKTGIIPASPEDECTAVTEEIQNLLDQIEELKRQCPDFSMDQDTMVIPDTFDDLDFTEGRWKSTSPLVNYEDKNVTLYFDFYSDGTGTITPVEPDGTTCSASLSIGPLNNTIDIDQLGPAICTNGVSYNPYKFSCKQGAKGYAICFAQNKIHSVNKFEFTLIKVKNQ